MAKRGRAEIFLDLQAIYGTRKKIINGSTSEHLLPLIGSKEGSPKTVSEKNVGGLRLPPEGIVELDLINPNYN